LGPDSLGSSNDCDSNPVLKIYKVTQKLESDPLADIEKEVRHQLDNLNLKVSGGEVAITGGSRGISNISSILKTAGMWFREKGASPFIVPCMGSHNGATAIGQKEMLQNLGISKETTGLEIRSSMDVVKLGSAGSKSVFMDRNCHESSGVLVINRIKQHTSFDGPIQSGLVKMMVVGMGKINGAETFHKASPEKMSSLLNEMAAVILDTNKILGGLGIVEDGHEQTSVIKGCMPQNIIHDEEELLTLQKSFSVKIPVDNINVLIVKEMGKNISGTGMDTKIIRNSGIEGYVYQDKPKVIGVLSLTDESGGNGLGVGLADGITQILNDSIDMEKTMINVKTTGHLQRGKIPKVYKDEETLILGTLAQQGKTRWVFINNTLKLEQFYISEDLIEEIMLNKSCNIQNVSINLEFEDGKLSTIYT